MKKKIILYISIIIFSTISLFFNLNKNKKFINEKIEFDKNSLLAIMVETSNGNYDQIEDGSFPGRGYSFNNDKSYCMDINDNLIPGNEIMSYEDGNIKVTTSKNVTCVAYFDKVPEYTVNLTVVNGTSNVSSVTLYSGEDAEFIITPTDPIDLEIKKDNCGGVIEDNKYIIRNVTENKNCLVTVKKNGIVLYEMMQENAKNDSIDFNKRSGLSGTNGIYTTTSTNSGSPVYFYRGNVNNNIIFGGFCWKIVRTTETKGVKLLYNGVPTNGTCVNTGSQTLIGNSIYNNSTIDNTYVGYMYASFSPYYEDGGKSSGEKSFEAGPVASYCGSSYTFNPQNGIYTLSGNVRQTQTISMGQCYTCISATTSCAQMYWAIRSYYVVNWQYHTLDTNPLIRIYHGTTSYSNAHSNTLDSTLKTTVDSWYRDNLENKNSKNLIEDTVYCNDRNPVRSNSNNNLYKTVSYYQTSYGTNGYAAEDTGYGVLSRASYHTSSANPTLICKNSQGSVPENNDAFTVSSTIGNGKLTYPVGLLTADEAVFAGYNVYTGNSDANDSNSYISNGVAYWTMSPVYNNSGASYIAIIHSSNMIYNSILTTANGVRPVISLKSDTLIETTGNGSTSSPYIVVEN